MALSVPHRFYYFVAIRELCYFWLLLVLLLGAISVFSVIIAIISVIISLVSSWLLIMFIIVVITLVTSLIILLFYFGNFCGYDYGYCYYYCGYCIVSIFSTVYLLLSDKWLFMNVKDCRT